MAVTIRRKPTLTPTGRVATDEPRIQTLNPRGVRIKRPGVAPRPINPDLRKAGRVVKSEEDDAMGVIKGEVQVGESLSLSDAQWRVTEVRELIVVVERKGAA